jgi:hypothetical protein
MRAIEPVHERLNAVRLDAFRPTLHLTGPSTQLGETLGADSWPILIGVPVTIEEGVSDSIGVSL